MSTTNDTSNNAGHSGLSDDTRIQSVIAKIGAYVPTIVSAVEKIPEAYRVATFREALRTVLEGERAHGDNGMLRSGNYPAPTGGISSADSATASLAVSLNVDAALLARTIQVSDDGSVQLLARVPGRSVRERQIKVARIICYIREKLFSEFKTDVEILRAACVAHGAYDSPNFVTNFRKDGTLREASVPGSKDRLYMLSPSGITEAEAALRELLATA